MRRFFSLCWYDMEIYFLFFDDDDEALSLCVFYGGGTFCMYVLFFFHIFLGRTPILFFLHGWMKEFGGGLTYGNVFFSLRAYMGGCLEEREFCLGDTKGIRKNLYQVFLLFFFLSCR